ncbi:MAG: hypothetical protein M1826_000585 [Phylliscum demangeonii]|nr:MAG: hypothetical protein M1826_000585 [Phylliscum demangeonii]
MPNARPTTPIAASPSRNRPPTLTLAQKQALIDHLQLEVTERARKLRAQYALQAQGLRARIEIRVNRIPVALRKAKMGELLAKHEGTGPGPGPGREGESPTAVPVLVSTAADPVASENATKASSAQEKANQSRKRGSKRKSDDLDDAGADKENTPQPDIEVPKKRSKPAATRAASNRAASRAKLQASQVLSPKSTNSRILSPVRPPPYPSRSSRARPPSSMKPALPHVAIASVALAGVVEKAKATRALSGRSTKATKTATAARKVTTTTTAAAANAKKGAGVEKRVASHVSQTSVATTDTVVTKAKGAGKAAGKAAGKGKAAAAAATAAAVKKTARSNNEVAVVSQRVLRSKRA